MLMELLLNQTHTYKFNGPRYLFIQFFPFQCVWRCVRVSLKINCMARNSRSVNFTFTFIDITSWKEKQRQQHHHHHLHHHHRTYACMHACTDNINNLYKTIFQCNKRYLAKAIQIRAHTRTIHFTGGQFVSTGLGVNSGGPNVWALHLKA